MTSEQALLNARRVIDGCVPYGDDLARAMAIADRLVTACIASAPPYRTLLDVVTAHRAGNTIIFSALFLLGSPWLERGYCSEWNSAAGNDAARIANDKWQTAARSDKMSEQMLAIPALIHPILNAEGSPFDDIYDDLAKAVLASVPSNGTVVEEETFVQYLNIVSSSEMMMSPDSKEILEVVHTRLREHIDTITANYADRGRRIAALEAEVGELRAKVLSFQDMLMTLRNMQADGEMARE